MRAAGSNADHRKARLQSINLDYCRCDERGASESPSAYEHLLLDSLRGDPTFFARADEVEAAWEIVEPVIKKWGSEKSTDFPNYTAGSDGPAEADELLARDGRYWYDATDQAGCRINIKDADSSRAKGAER